MVNEEIVRNTITKMREAGISENMISSTLADLGLSAAQVQAYLSGRSGTSEKGQSDTILQEAAGQTNYRETPSRNMEENMDRDFLATRTSEKVVQRMNEEKASDAGIQQVRDTITHLAMEQHGQQLQDTHNSIMELHDKFDATNMDSMSNRLTQLNNKMEHVENDVSDLKALSGALQSLLQKILETNQQLLFESKKNRE